MWAPADLFSHALDIFLFPLKRGVSYLYEHLIVLALVILAAAALITAVTILGARRASRS